MVLVVTMCIEQISQPVYMGHDMINGSYLFILLEAI